MKTSKILALILVLIFSATLPLTTSAQKPDPAKYGGMKTTKHVYHKKPHPANYGAYRSQQKGNTNQRVIIKPQPVNRTVDPANYGGMRTPSPAKPDPARYGGIKTPQPVPAGKPDPAKYGGIR